MAATANTNRHATALSPPSSGLPGDVHGGSHSGWSPAGSRNPSPWTKIIRGGESEVPVASPSGASTFPPAAAAVFHEQTSVNNKGVASPENLAVVTQPESSANGNSNDTKKPAWNKPSNVNLESGTVMGAASWPALSESTRASPKLSSSDSPKIPSDASASFSQVTGNAAASSSLPSLSSQKQASGNANSNPTPNHGRPTRQKSMKRESGGNGVANGGFSHLSTPYGSVGEASHTSSMKPGSGGGPDSSARDHTHNNANREPGQRNAGDQAQQRTAFRRGNSGWQSRGDGSSHQNYGGRRDQDRGNHDWNHQRNFNSRDAPMQTPRAFPRGFIRPPSPGSAPFIPAPPLGPFVGPMGMPELPIYYIGPQSMPFVTPIPPMFPPPDLQLHAKIVNQIDYYFSNENLIKDTYLRHNMDELGWVPVTLIAGFKKVMQLTGNVQLILDALRSSTVVEVQGDKIRKRENWKRWIMPSSVQFPTGLGSESPRLQLEARIQSVGLDEKPANHSSSRGQLASQARENHAGLHPLVQNSKALDKTLVWISKGIQVMESNGRIAGIGFWKLLQGRRLSIFLDPAADERGPVLSLIYPFPEKYSVVYVNSVVRIYMYTLFLNGSKNFTAKAYALRGERLGIV
ncbi:hypothetical protein Nepgr_016758 [Nepenthes gracilis]|uniref:HTH La-type RNA-binding domain-containing protein n=1 Tax=Nepenthes gracilis TaxID=150966 RepID=A0AAD3SPX4_NEPGR|nr:hypothetical protein Nepgr_016758 [Nepenthes gracilis]